MEVINKKERRNSFILFIVLFLITVVIVIVAVSSTFNIDKTQLITLRKEKTNWTQREIFQKKFEKDVDELNQCIDSIGGSKLKWGDTEWLTKFNMKYQNVQKYVSDLDDQNPYRSMYVNHLTKLNQIANLKQQIKQNQSETDEMRQLETENSQLKDANRDLKSELDNCKLQVDMLR